MFAIVMFPNFSFFVFLAHASVLESQVLVRGATFPYLIACLLAGFFATVIMMLATYLLRYLFKSRVDIPHMLGDIIAPTAHVVWRLRLGMATQLFIGAVWGFVFGLLTQHRIFSLDVNIQSALVFSLLPWFFMMLVDMPLDKEGAFGIRKDAKISVVTLCGHIVYGLMLVPLIPLLFFAS